MDVKLNANEDGLLIDSLAPLRDEKVADWRLALAAADDISGRVFRDQNVSYQVKVILAQDIDAEKPMYRIQYGREVGGTQRELRIDARTASTSLAPEEILPTAASLARVHLGGEVRLVNVSVTWQSPGANRVRAYGAEKPSRYTFTFIRGDINFPTTVSVTMEAGHETIAGVSGTGSFRGGVGADSRTMPVPPFSLDEMVAAFKKVDAEALRARREELVTQGYALWDVSASSAFADGRWYIDIFHSARRTPNTPSDAGFRFRYDPATGEID